MHRSTFVASCLLLIAAQLWLTGCAQPVLSTDSSSSSETSVAVADSDDSRIPGSRLLYLTPDEDGLLQLATTNLPTQQSDVLTDETEGLIDFSVAPDGNRVVYSAWNETGGADLWMISPDGADVALIVACPDSACGRATWSPDGSRLVYERHGGGQQGVTPVLWEVDLRSGRTGPLFPDYQHATASASWSPDGQWFSYFTPDAAETIVYQITDGRQFAVPNELASPILWDPDGLTLRTLSVRQEDDLNLAILVPYDLQSGLARPVDEFARLADREAAWSPTGDWLAITRRDWRGAYPSKTQIWLMRGDGSDAHAVLADSAFQFLSPVWSPDGKFLLFQRYADSQVFIQPEVWILEWTTGKTELMLPSAGQVVWLP